jgi:Kef-type K+ transport system membrane component KefB
LKQADINPFEGILLGIFFVTAGSALDPSIVIQYWPTLVAGISAFLFIKFSVIYAGGGELQVFAHLYLVNVVIHQNQL